MGDHSLLINIRERMEKVVAQNDLIIRQNTTIHKHTHEIISILKPKNKIQFLITINFQNLKIQSTDMKTATVTMGHPDFDLIATPINANNEVAEVEANTEGATSSNEAVLTIAEDPQNQSRYVITLVGPGESDVTISGDADLGSGVATIDTVIHFFVLPAPATEFQITLPGDVVIGEQ